MSMPVETWICNELSKLLDIDAGEDIARYILTIENAADLEDYMRDLLDCSRPSNRRFVDELLYRCKHSAPVPADVKVYKKSDINDSYIPGEKSRKSKNKSKKSYSSENVAPSVNGTAVDEQYMFSQADTGQGARPKTKFVPLFSEEGAAKTVAKLPGRHGCECQASKHALINNCLSCGKVVCAQEGPGPCLFCGALVCTKEQQEFIDKGSKKGEKLRQRLMIEGSSPHGAGEGITNALEKAIRHKDKLLEYDQTSVKRTHVIDDESDYFATETGTWLTNSEKAALQKREEELRSVRHSSRRDRKITFDFAGRRIVETAESVDMYNVDDDVIQQVHYGSGQIRGDGGAVFTKDDFCNLVNPDIETNPPKFVPPDVGTCVITSAQHETSAAEQKKKTLRLQDRELREMSDEGTCLSMHQPWASLLVRGIKQHEGRTWYSTHRGRLWIAATSQQPSPEDIADLELTYRAMYKGAPLSFPKAYPVSCLLGCVNIEDCLEQDVYRTQFPDGESESPFVFVSSQPQELVVKFPMKGKHKIYKLDSSLHQAAKRGLRTIVQH